MQKNYLIPAWGELSAVVRGQPCLLVGDFNVEPTKILYLAKEISVWLWVDLEAESSLLLLPSAPEVLLVVIVGTLWLVALWLLLLFCLVGLILTGALPFILLSDSFLLCWVHLSGCSVCSAHSFVACLWLLVVGKVCSSRLGLMLFCWMSPCVWVMFLVLRVGLRGGSLFKVVRLGA